MNFVMLLAGATIKGSILLVLAWVLIRALRRASAAARHLVWASALGGMLLMPLFVVVVPALRLSVIPQLPNAASITTTSAPAATPQDAAATRTPVSTAAGSVPSADVAAKPAVAARTFDLLASLPLLWAIGAALLLLRLAIGTLRVSVWTRRAQLVDDGGWLALVQRLAARLGITRPVILLRSERACVPMTWGVVYPTVLLPIDADEWNAERRTIVLLHELAHVKRLDAFTQLLAQVATGVFWFNPLVWLAAREMRKEREHACDDFVLQGGARASDYAHDLLQIARSLGSSSAPAAAALAMARRSEFEGRLLAILDPKTDRRSVSRARLAVATLGVVALALPLAALAPAREAREAREPSKATTTVDSMVFESTMQQELHVGRANAAAPTPTPALPAAPSPEIKPLSSIAKSLMARVTPPAAETVTKAVAARTPAVQQKQPPPPDRETLISVARAAAKMTSDYEKAELLITIAKYYMPDDELRTIYLEAVSTMTSDYDRGRTLKPLLAKDGALSAKALTQIVKITSTFSSDYEKANLIVSTVGATGDGRILSPDMRGALIGAMGAIRSDYDRRRAIEAMVRRGEINGDDAIGLINAAGGMTSGYDKATALVAIAEQFGLNDPGVRKAYFKAAETITSGSDYRRAMAAILK